MIQSKFGVASMCFYMIHGASKGPKDILSLTIFLYSSTLPIQAFYKYLLSPLIHTRNTRASGFFLLASFATIPY
jgi:hypothetical protein